MPPTVLTGADAERAFQEATGQSTGSAATTISAKAALHDRGMATYEHPPAPDRNTGGIPTKDEAGNVVAPPPRPPARPPAPPAPEGQGQGQELTLPEKFANAEDPQAALLQAYLELERRQGQPPAPEPEAQGEAPAAPVEEPLSPTFRSPEDEAQFTTSVVNAVGGQDVFESLAAWAPEYGDPVTVMAFNTAVANGDQANALLAVKALRYEMTTRQGIMPTLVGGLAMGGQAGPQPFNSNAELRAAMRDPRYMPGPRQDGAYVEEVQSRLAASMGG